jgi:perosamine synthetase
VLRALGVGAGDEVIVPGYTCVVAVNPAKFLGATPIYVDIAPATYNINPELIERAITPKTKLIVAQHTYGFPADMDAILDVANRHGLPVMEDSCLAVGSTYKGRKTGSFGIAAAWSGQWNKTFTTGIGGMVTTADKDLAAKIEALREAEAVRPSWKETAMLAAQRMVHRAIVYPRTVAMIQSVFRWMTAKGLVVGSSSTGECKLEAGADFFKRMGAAQGRVGARQVRRVEANIAHRRKMAAYYDGLLDELGWPRPAIPESIDPVLVRYPVRVADKDKAVAMAPKARVELGTWFESPLHQSLVSLDVYDYALGQCPESEKAAREVVNLPTHRRANQRVARRGVEFIRQIGPA